MEIVFHIGAHCTDDGHIQACLVKNRALLAEEGIIVPNPGRFRPILRETITALQGGVANKDVQQVMLDSIIKEDDPQRIIFSNDAFICGLSRVLADNTLYPDAGERVRKLVNLFAGQEVEICLAIRNPASFIPACFAKLKADSFEAYVAQIDPMSIRWSELISRLQATLPGVPIKVWSNEDTPFIWYELIGEIADHSAAAKLKGVDDYLASIMTKEGMERMTTYLDGHPPANEIQRRRILSAFLDKFVIEEEDIELNLASWTEEYVEQLTDIYEQDLYRIERMAGVQFISP